MLKIAVYEGPYNSASLNNLVEGLSDEAVAQALNGFSSPASNKKAARSIIYLLGHGASLEYARKVSETLKLFQGPYEDDAVEVISTASIESRDPNFISQVGNVLGAYRDSDRFGDFLKRMKASRLYEALANFNDQDLKDILEYTAQVTYDTLPQAGGYYTNNILEVYPPKDARNIFEVLRETTSGFTGPKLNDMVAQLSDGLAKLEVRAFLPQLDATGLRSLVSLFQKYRLS